MKRSRDLETIEELNSMYQYAFELEMAIFHLYEEPTDDCKSGFCSPCRTRGHVFNRIVQERLNDK